MKILFSILVCALATLAFALTGCSDVSGSGDGGSGSGGDGGTAGSGGSGGPGGTGGAGGTGGTTEKLPLIVSACETIGISASCVRPAQGVEVCEDDTDNCALTDESGSALIMLPANHEIAYTITKDDYSYLEYDVTDETFVGLSSGWPVFTESQVEDIADHVMIDYPLEGSFLILGAIPFRAGVTFELIGHAARSFYSDEDGVAQLDLDETTSFGRGGFLDLAPGDYEVEFGGAVANCTPSISPHSDTPNRVTVTIREGHHTYASMQCDEPSQ